MRKFTISACALALVASVAFAGDEPPKKQMTKEEMAQMEAMMKAATPGEAHKKLDGMVGTWDAKITMYEPNATSHTSTGVAENRWVLGNRWVEQKFSGNFMGMPFEGIGYSGYDNIKKQYIGTWMDNMSTSVMVTNGNIDASGKTMTFTSTMDDPMTGKPVPMTQKATIIDADHSVWEMWGPGPDGKLYKMMEIAYSRKK